MQKNILYLLLLALLASCAGQEAADDAMPASLADKQEALRAKKAQLSELTSDIEALEVAIAEQDPSAGPRRTLVSTAPIKRQDFVRYVSLQGAVAADDLVDATAEIGGRILKLTVREGDAVRRGQLIAVVDVESIEKQIEEVETSLELANTVYERNKRLWDQNIGSEITYLQAKNNRDRLVKSLESLRVQLRKRNVYAPIGGAVERVVLQSGELAAPGTPIVQILNTSRLKVEADIPETYLQSVNRGKSVRVKIPALDLDFTSPITQVGRTIDEANRTFKVEISLPSNNSRLKPNLLAELLLEDYNQKDAIVLPLDRVQQEVGGRKYVFVVQENEQGKVAQKRYIETGESADGSTIVTQGLTGDEELIMRGARTLTDGQSIEVETVAKQEKNG